MLPETELHADRDRSVAHTGDSSSLASTGMALQFSRYPAMVSTSDGTVVNRSVVVVIDGHAQLAVQMPHQYHEPGGVQVIATLDDVTVEKVNRHKTTLTAADGQSWTVGEGDGCSCRNALTDWLRQQIKGQPLGT